MQLEPFQVKALHSCQGILDKFAGCMLRMDEGLGKTIIGYKVSQDYEKVLWVAKAKDIKDLRRKLKEYGDDKPEIISYQGFAKGKYQEKTAGNYRLIIFDEAHNLRNWNASYTKAFCKTRSTKTDFLFLTATPAIRNERDYFYVLRKCGAFKQFKTNADMRKHFLGAWQSHYGDFLEDGEFQNREEFWTYADRVIVDVTSREADTAMPSTIYNILIVPGQWRKAQDFTKETETRVTMGAEKVDNLHVFNTDSNTNHLILFVFHENAKKFAERWGMEVALDAESVQKAIEDRKTNPRPLVTTMGLTGSSYDFNECDQVSIFESTYSFATDRQSIRRCLRLGKKNDLVVSYYAFKEELPLLKSLSRYHLTGKHDTAKSFGPSSFAIWEKCPGSYYYESAKPPHVNIAAFIGTQNHAVIERYVENPGLEVPSIVEPYVKEAIRFMRKKQSEAESWGAEERVHLSHIDEKCRGTADFWWITKGGHLNVLDYKNGKSKVNVEDNLQLQAYACMLINTLKLEPTKITLHIMQRDNLSSCGFQLNKVQPTVERIRSIVERVKEAASSPADYLNTERCSFFCSAFGHHPYDSRAIKPNN